MQTKLEKSVLSYPRDLNKNMDARIELINACEKDSIFAKDVIDVFSDTQNILSWINLTCWSKNPKVTPDVFPFITYPFQDDYILELVEAIKNQYDLLTDKTREMGVSWCVLFVFHHFWRFESGSDFRVGSRKEDFVDKLGVIDTLLEKVRFNIEKQPAFLWPRGFNLIKHAGFMRIINPENKNMIVGESANNHFGSGGRSKAILLDEYSKWEPAIADAAWTSTADVSSCRLPVSTPLGSGNKFGLLANGSTDEHIKKISLHWTLHPVKGKGAYYLDNNVKIPVEEGQGAFQLWQKGIEVRSPWYDKECERRSESDIAQELDINYLKSGSPFFNIPALNTQRIWEYIERKLPTDSIPYGRYITVDLVDIDNKIELRENPEGWLRIFELPKKGYQYVNANDIAEGLEKGDEDFLVIRDKITRNVVACANGKWDTDEWAVMMYKAGKLYNDATVAPENNNHGHSVCSDLKNMDCKLYYTTLNDQGIKTTTKKAGWTTTAKTRPEMLDQAEEEVRKSAVQIRDGILIGQMKVFVRNAHGKPEADGMFKDDGVMAFSIGGAIIKEEPFATNTGKGKTTDAQKAAMVHELSKPMAGFRSS